MPTQAQLNSWKAQNEQALARFLPRAGTAPEQLSEAMRYAVLNGGKRIRALLVYASAQAISSSDAASRIDMLDSIAAAIEMIHAYSLVHDDLPAMDNDDQRRGKPSCHKAYNEATAILVGDALQSLAFELLAHCESPTLAPQQQCRMILILARAIGSQGMAGGQADDIAATSNSQQLTLTQLQSIHHRKTGALITSCAELACLAMDANEQQSQALTHFAQNLGLAFQIRDDQLDQQACEPTSYRQLLSETQMRDRLQALHTQAIAALDKASLRTRELITLADTIIHRTS